MGQPLNPLSESEQHIAREVASRAVVAATDVPALATSRQSAARSSGLDDAEIRQVLAVERRPPPKAAGQNAPRQANVNIYDYATDTLFLLVINVDTEAVQSLQSQRGQQPPLNDWEVGRAQSIAAQNPQTVAAIRRDYTRATGRAVADISSVEHTVLVFDSVFATNETNAQAARCGNHRCAQVIYFAPDDIVLETMAIVDLSLGEVAQLLPFGNAGAR